MLSDSESDEQESLHRFTINEHYAKVFQHNKEREELARLKEKYGSDVDEDAEGEDGDETDSEDASSEDEDGEELTFAVDAAILRTLARIKRKDPGIYDVDRGVFEEEQQKITPVHEPPLRNPNKSVKKATKPMTIRRVALESALHAGSRSPSPALSATSGPVPHAEAQRQLRAETIAAFHGAVSGEHKSDEQESDQDVDGGEDGDLLVMREKTRDEIQQEEQEYRTFLQREVGDDLETLLVGDERLAESTKGESEKEKAASGRKKKKHRDQEKDKMEGELGDADQQFLMNYILNRGWIDSSAKRIPTYGEVTGSSSRKGKRKGKDVDGEDDEGDNVEVGDDFDEDEFEDVVDAFETSYNFRFEEPDAETIKTYPRQLPALARREDTTRKEARERRKARKEEELANKREEIKRLKRAKMNEIKDKLERIGREGGKQLDDSQALQELDLDADWDSDAHDRQMAKIYGDDEDEADVEKPHWDEDIDIGDIVLPEAQVSSDRAKKAKKKRKKKDKTVDGGGDGVDVDKMDADIEPAEDGEEWDGTEEMRKRKLDEYMDEVYGLEFNDVIGGMPTRFKYTHVPAQSFALTPDEVLMATDAELNQYLSVKKYATYRKEGRWDHTRSERLKELKERLKTRGARWDGADLAEDEPRQSSKKRKGKKERMKAKDDPGVSESAPGPEAMAPPTEPAQTDAENALDGKPTERQEHTRRSGASSHKRKRQRVKGGHMGES